MRVQVVGNQDDDIGIPLVLFDQHTQLLGKVLRRPAVGHPHFTVTLQWLDGHEQVAHTTVAYS